MIIRKSPFFKPAKSLEWIKTFSFSLFFWGILAGLVIFCKGKQTKCTCAKTNMIFIIESHCWELPYFIYFCKWYPLRHPHLKTLYRTYKPSVRNQSESIKLHEPKDSRGDPTDVHVHVNVIHRKYKGLIYFNIKTAAHNDGLNKKTEI